MANKSMIIYIFFKLYFSYETSYIIGYWHLIQIMSCHESVWKKAFRRRFLIHVIHIVVGNQETEVDISCRTV